MTELIESIEALGEEHFAMTSGCKSEVYLDPETSSVYLFQDSENSQPVEAYRGTDLLICRISNRARPGDVVDCLLGVAPVLARMPGCYRGDGEWDWDSLMPLLKEVECLEIPTAIDADEWLGGSSGGECQ